VRRYPPRMSIKYTNGYSRSHNSQSRKMINEASLLCSAYWWRLRRRFKGKGQGLSTGGACFDPVPNPADPEKLSALTSTEATWLQKQRDVCGSDMTCLEGAYRSRIAPLSMFK
jgi:hypothetical protein